MAEQFTQNEACFNPRPHQLYKTNQPELNSLVFLSFPIDDVDVTAFSRKRAKP